MTNPISLNNFKNKKKYKKYITDLEAIIYIYSLTISALNLFSKYIIVRESIAVLEASKLMAQIHLKNIKNQV